MTSLAAQPAWVSRANAEAARKETITLSAFHQRSGRAAVVTTWLEKEQAAGRPAFVLDESMYSTGGRYTLVDNRDGSHTVRRDHDLTKDGFRRLIERNGPTQWSQETVDAYVSWNPLAFGYAQQMAAEAATRREQEQRQAEEQQRAQEAKYARQSTFRVDLEAKLTAAKFKKATAALAMPNGEPFKSVTGVAFKGLLVHRTTQGEGYDVSHVISGKRANSKSFATQAEGKAAVVRLVELGNWERTGDEIQADRPFCIAAAQLMLHISIEGVYSVK